MRSFGSSALADAPLALIARAQVRTGNWAARVVLATTVTLGVVFRLAPALSADFPVNDGGLFYAMIRDLQQAAYQLPLLASYNNAAIPFAYPPLPFYIAGVIDDLTPLTLFDVLRFLPAVTAVLSVGAMYLLARSFHASESRVAASVATFALLPEAFVWTIMGGGLTRSMGMLFALLAMRQAYELYARDRPRAVPWLILWSSLTALSHLEWVWLLALTSGALCISHCRSRRAVLLSSLVAIATLFCTAPWWVSVLVHHGLAPFQAALLSGHGTTGDVAGGMISPVQVLVFLAMILLLGLRRRRPFLLGWIGVIVLFNLRSVFRFSAIPLALANGEILGGPSFLAAGDSAAAGGPRESAAFVDRGLRLAFTVVIALLLWIEVLTPLVLTRGLGHLAALGPDERAAMAWIDRNTPISSQFVVVGGQGWAIDRSAEWFPVLAARESVGTVQGTEWLPGGAFVKVVDSSERLDQCVHQNARCLDSWANELGVGFSHVYLPARQSAPCCELRESLRHDSSYLLIYENPGALVFARAPDPA